MIKKNDEDKKKDFNNNQIEYTFKTIFFLYIYLIYI